MVDNVFFHLVEIRCAHHFALYPLSLSLSLSLSLYLSVSLSICLSLPRASCFRSFVSLFLCFSSLSLFAGLKGVFLFAEN